MIFEAKMVAMEILNTNHTQFTVHTEQKLQHISHADCELCSLHTSEITRHSGSPAGTSVAPPFVPLDGAGAAGRRRVAELRDGAGVVGAVLRAGQRHPPEPDS